METFEAFREFYGYCIEPNSLNTKSNIVRGLIFRVILYVNKMGFFHVFREGEMSTYWNNAVFLKLKNSASTDY